MKMKNYLIGFIIAMVSIIPISNIKALSIDGFEFDLPDLPTTKKSDYYTIAKNNNNDIYLIFFDNVKTVNGLDNSVVKIYYGLSLGGGSVSLSGKSYSHNVYYYKLVDNTWSYINYGKYDVISYDLENDIGITSEEWMSDINLVKPYLQDKILYTNLNYFACDSNINNCELFFSKEDLKSNEYLSYEYDIKQSEDGNYSYYDIRLFTNNYNSNYEYLVKFDDEPFRNITTYLNDEEGLYYQIPYDTTMYLLVRDESRETLQAETMSFVGLINQEEYDKPTIDINISCGTDFNSNIERSLIELDFNNYSTSYKYQYSFNNIDFIDIPYEEIKNKKYVVTTYLNTSFFVRILDKNNNVIFENNDVIKCIISDKDNKTYIYELSLEDLYDKENHKLIFYTFYYENSNFSENRDFKPYVYFFYTGNEKLDFHISYNTNAIDLPKYNESLMTKTLSELPCTSLPFEYIDNTIFNNNYTSYTVFSFMPCIDLSTFLYNDQYQDFKLIIKSNIKLDIGEPISFGGNFVPSTNKPIDDSNSFQSNYTNFFSIFTDSFNRFKNVIIEIFQHCTYFFSTVSPILQDFYITIFVLILFIFLIRFIL